MNYQPVLLSELCSYIMPTVRSEWMEKQMMPGAIIGDTLAGLFSYFDDAHWMDENKLSDERLKNLIAHIFSLPEAVSSKLFWGGRNWFGFMYLPGGRKSGQSKANQACPAAFRQPLGCGPCGFLYLLSGGGSRENDSCTAL